MSAKNRGNRVKILHGSVIRTIEIFTAQSNNFSSWPKKYQHIPSVVTEVIISPCNISIKRIKILVFDYFL